MLMTCWNSKAQTIAAAFHFPMIPPKCEQRYTCKTTLASSSSSEMPQTRLTNEDGIYIVNKMPPPLPNKLNNSYYMLRHGQSWGNVEQVISSARSLAKSEKHGLTPLGYEQGKESAKSLLNLLKVKQEKFTDAERVNSLSRKKRRIFFYSSPFARARQTAQACLDGLLGENRQLLEEMNLDVQTNVILENGIMERFFGRLDDDAIETYAYIWPVDMVNVTHTEFDVESVAAVSTRLRETILKIDASSLHDLSVTPSSEHEADIIIFVSHADVLQIAQLYAADIANVGQFSSYRFKNGEVREMAQTVDSLPDPQPLELPKTDT